MASEDVSQDNLAEVKNQNEENTETADIATSDAKGEGTESKSNQQDEVEKEVKLYVGNLPDQCRRGALQELFEKYGKVSQCDIVKNFAFVVSFTCLKWCSRIAAYATFRHHIDLPQASSTPQCYQIPSTFALQKRNHKNDQLLVVNRLAVKLLLAI